MLTGSTPCLMEFSSRDPICFEVPSNYEITVQGKKLVGSAQARRKNGVLQHGTIPLCGDLSRITQVLAVSDETTRQANAQRLLMHATTVENTLGQPVTWDQAAQAVSAAFKDVFGLQYDSSTLTPLELQKAHDLQQTKYAHPAWTNRV